MKMAAICARLRRKDKTPFFVVSDELLNLGTLFSDRQILAQLGNLNICPARWEANCQNRGQ